MARTWTQEQKDEQARKMRDHHARKKGEQPAAAALGQPEETPPSRGEPRNFDPPPDSGQAPRTADPKPGSGAKRAAARAKPRSSKATDAELTATLGKLLAAPALPAKLILHCDYCAMHFATQANPTAAELVTLAQDSPELRGFLEDLHGYYSKITWFGIIAGYVAKPIAHHMAPNQVLAATEPFLGVPPRPDREASEHQHSHSGPAASPFMVGGDGGVDLSRVDLSGIDFGAAMAAVQEMSPEEVQAAAASMGIVVDPSAIIAGNGDTPDSAGQPAEHAEPAPVAGEDTGQPSA